jgi:hypothetical protein
MEQRREELSTADLADQPKRESETSHRERPDDPGTDTMRDDDLSYEKAPTDRPRPAARVADFNAPPEQVGPEELDPAAAPARQDPLSAPTTATPASRSSGEPRDAGDSASASPLMAGGDADSFQARWTDVQNSFVDSPRRAVEAADALVAELMQHLASTFADERSRLEGQWDRGDDVSTDELRTAFQRYRSFFGRLLAT